MGTPSPCSLISALVVPTEDLYRLAKSYIDYPQFLKNERDKETMAPNFIGHVQSRRYHVPSLVNTGLNQLAGQHYSKIRLKCARLIGPHREGDRKSTRLNSSHLGISYAVF